MNEMVEIPGGEHDPGIGEEGAGHPGNLRRQLEEAVRAPGGAARAGAAALVVRPDPDIVDADAFKCGEDLPAPFEEQLSCAGLARTELDVIVPAGLLEVPVVPGGPVGAQVGRAVFVGFVGEQGDRGLHAESAGGLEHCPQAPEHALGGGIVDGAVGVHVEPDAEGVVAPEGDIFDVLPHRFEGSILVIIVEVGGEVNAAHGFGGL